MICFIFYLVVLFFSFLLIKNAFLIFSLGYMSCGQLKSNYVAKSLILACYILFALTQV